MPILEVPHQLVLVNKETKERTVLHGGVAYAKVKAEKLRDMFRLLYISIPAATIEAEPINVSLN